MSLRRLICAAAALLAAPAALCSGHGTPVIVHVVDGQLTVSNGVEDAVGYADWVYADEDPEAWLTPGPNSTQLTTLPGLDVNDMMIGDALSLEVLSRPDFSQPGRPQRWLWHWNAASGEVALEASDRTLDLVPARGFEPVATLEQSTPPANSVVKVADLLDTDVGEHRHLLLYKLDDAPPAAPGVYGFFARLTAPGYEASAPFLIALNNGLDDALMYQQGAIQINAAAGLAGDFNIDGKVDGTDFLAWQKTLATSGVYLPADGGLDGNVNASDLPVWRDEFARSVMYPPPPSAAEMTPEPQGAALAMLACAAIASAARRLTTAARRCREHTPHGQPAR